MATLAVRTLRATDLPALRSVRQRADRLDGPLCRFRSPSDAASRLRAALPGQLHDERAFVATVDGELCALLIAQRQPVRYQWELVSVEAGSPRLDATDDVCVELWSALIEFTVKEAGASGAKRIFAATRDSGPAYESLKANGFGAYETLAVMTGTLDASAPVVEPAGMRPQVDSDVWSIHQLYNQVTPRAVQFAEALTSSEWSLDTSPWWRHLAPASPQVSSYVLEDEHGVQGYCRVERKPGRAMLSFMVAPQCSAHVAAFLLASAKEAGVNSHDIIQILVPGYAVEHQSVLQEAGFHVSWERTRMVKHTTVPVVVRPKLAAVPTGEERERAIRGVPSLSRNA